MVKNFIENLISNVNNEEALTRSLNELIEANKTAYKIAVEQLENQQGLDHDESLNLPEPSNRLDQLLRHLS